MPHKLHKPGPEYLAWFDEHTKHMPTRGWTAEERKKVDDVYAAIERGDDFYSLDEWDAMTPEQRTAAIAKWSEPGKGGGG